MASGALIAGGVVLVAGGAAYLLYKKQQAAKAKASSQCDALKGVDDTAYQACKAALDVYGIVSGIIDAFDIGGPSFDQQRKQWAANDAQNKQLNGAVRIGNSVGLCTGYLGQLGTAIEFENGCQPFSGAPGWSKCLPGTTPMEDARDYGDGPNVIDWRKNDTVGVRKALVATSDWSKLLTGKQTRSVDPDGTVRISGDPMSGVVGEGTRDLASTCYGQKFPLPVPPGAVAYYYKGKPGVCQNGRPVFDGADPVKCNAPGGTHETVDLSKGNPPPGYTYVATPTPHWERVRKGQTPQPYPGGDAGSDPSTLLLGYSVAPGH